MVPVLPRFSFLVAAGAGWSSSSASPRSTGRACVSEASDRLRQEDAECSGGARGAAGAGSLVSPGAIGQPSADSDDCAERVPGDEVQHRDVLTLLWHVEKQG